MLGRLRIGSSRFRLGLSRFGLGRSLTPCGAQRLVLLLPHLVLRGPVGALQVEVLANGIVENAHRGAEA